MIRRPEQVGGVKVAPPISWNDRSRILALSVERETASLDRRQVEQLIEILQEALR